MAKVHTRAIVQACLKFRLYIIECGANTHGTQQVYNVHVCAITMGVGMRRKPPLHPIAVQRPFQILGLDVMDLSVTERGNCHVVVIQDLFMKWPFVFAVPDQKSPRIARFLAELV